MFITMNNAFLFVVLLVLTGGNSFGLGACAENFKVALCA